MLNAFAWRRNYKNHTAGIHRLLRGLPGYLILFDTRAFEHERRYTEWHPAFAIGVLRDIYAFHRYTTSSECLRRTQEGQSQPRDPVEQGHLTADLNSRLRSL